MQFKIKYVGNMDPQNAISNFLRIVRASFPNAQIYNREKPGHYTLNLWDEPTEVEVELLRFDCREALIEIEK